MKSAVAWLRRVYPPWWAVMIALVLYAFFELPYWSSRVYWWARGIFPPAEDFVGLLAGRDGFILMVAGAYAIYRVGLFHPLFRPNYRRWLEQTPWTVEKPLPLGPVHLVAQDVLMLLFFRLLLHDFQLPEVVLPQVFLYSYLIVAVPALSETEERAAAYLVVFGIGLAILANWWSPPASLASLFICYFVAMVGMRRSLRRFPWVVSVQRWNTIWRKAQAGNATTKQQEMYCSETELPPASLGWPHNHLSAQTDPQYISRGDRIVRGLLAGWLYFAIAANPDAMAGSRMGGTMVLFVYLTFGCVIARLFAYCGNYWPPISLWGRLWTGRWIIPGYDKVFIAPLLTALLGWGGVALVAAYTDGEQPWCAPICGGILALVLIITTAVGPSLQRWRLTAPARIGQTQLSGGKVFEKI